MPNNINNILRVSGDFDYLTQFKKDSQYKNNVLAFSQSVPINNNNINEKELKWGCKSEPYEVVLIETKNYLMYTFVTPWKSPDKWIEVIKQKYPSLKIEHEAHDEAYSDNEELDSNFKEIRVCSNQKLER
jgi:hypothetical protein